MSNINKTQWSHQSQESAIISGQHDAVVVTVPFKAETANMPAGSLVSIDLNSGELTTKTADSDIFGVLTKNYSAADGNLGNVLVHGAVNLNRLRQAKGEALSTTEIVLLINKGIYPL